MRSLFSAIVLVLVGCASDPDSIKTLTGFDVGKPEWVKIEPGESRLRVPVDFYQVVAREKTKLADRYLEYVDLSNGYLELEHAYDGGFSDPKSNHHFRRMFEGITFNREPLVTQDWEPKRSGRVTFAEFMHTDLLCVAVTKTLGKPFIMGSGALPLNEASLQGVYCDLEETDRFTEMAIAFAKNVRMHDWAAAPEQPVPVVKRDLLN